MLTALPLPRVAAALEAVLTDIEALARRMTFESWDQVFAAARATLHADPPPQHFFSADFERYAGFDATQQRVAGAVLGAWVFGGMGSWNDIAPEERFAAEYDMLSERLFITLNDAICALANSTCRA